VNWKLWRRQTGALLRLELKKGFFSRRAWWVYLLALAPVLLAGAHSFFHRGRCSIASDNMAFAGTFDFFYLRLGIFFGCVGIFANLFRSEMLEKTLHYYLLVPVRREVVLLSKYISGLAASIVLLAGSVALTFLLISAHFGAQYEDFIFHGPGLAQLEWYVVVTVLACVGYGAVFLVSGLLLRNPMIPAAAVWVWESINPFLPPLLKKFSVIFYLKSLCPVQVPVRQTSLLQMLLVSADPTPAWVAITGLLAVSLLVLVFAAVRVRRVEISYGE
jgi:ABC-type transport system involved in multi-copper enzyme maturation permease subunit